MGRVSVETIALGLGEETYRTSCVAGPYVMLLLKAEA